MAEIATIGLDIAKSVFQLPGIDVTGQVVVRRQLRRSHALKFFGSLPGCLVGIEACATSHYWSRQLQALGHNVKRMPRPTLSLMLSDKRTTWPMPRPFARL